jgi:hypothetical protein
MKKIFNPTILLLFIVSTFAATGEGISEKGYLTSIIVSVENSGMPIDFRLMQNYPNPFNPSTVISFSVAEVSDVKIEIFNLLGQKVALLIDEFKNQGTYNVSFNPSGLVAGVYIYRMKAGNFTASRKLVLLK